MAAAGRLFMLAAAGAVLGAAAAAPSAHDLAGRYTHSFRNGDVTGARFTSTDSLIIVPVDRRRAIFDMQLNFFNGHECSIGGLATLEGSRLVFRDPEPGFDGRRCTLTIWRDRARLRWDDGEDSCRGNCGARGSLGDGGMNWASRRPIPPAEQRRIRAEYERERNLP